MHAPSIFVALAIMMASSEPVGLVARDDLDKARQQYQESVHKAQQDYNAAVEAAAGKLRVRIQAALEQATKARQMDVAKSLLAELDTLAPGALQLPGTRTEVVPGTWRVTYHPGSVRRTYVIKAAGDVTCEELSLSGSIRQDKGSLLLDLHDGKLERLTFAGGRVFVEHFDPKDSFPTLSLVGIGEIVSSK